MEMYKYIYWRPDKPADGDGRELAHIHIVAGSWKPSLSNFLEMAEVMRETFEDATNDKITGAKILAGTNRDFAVICYNAYIPKKVYPGWTQCKDPRSQTYSF